MVIPAIGATITQLPLGLQPILFRQILGMVFWTLSCNPPLSIGLREAIQIKATD
jgi:hypothetical protein